MVMGFAALGAQLIGGVLMQLDVAGLGWRTVFLINLPVGIAGLVLTSRFVSESRAAVGMRIDVLGTALVTCGLTALLLPLVEGPHQGWPSWTLVSVAAAPVILVAFVVHQVSLARAGGSPVLDPAMFRNRAFSTGLITQLAFWCGQASFFLVLALYLQQGRGLSPLEAGEVFTILAAAYLVTSLRAPALTPRFGRDLIGVGALLLAAGDALLMLAVGDVGTSGSILSLVPGFVLVGAGMGLCITPLVSIVLASVDPIRAGAASGTVSTVQQLGNSLGVAVTGLVFFGQLHAGYAPAFQLSVAQLGGLLVVVAALTRLLPRQAS
jgi:MFS family permease